MTYMRCLMLVSFCLFLPLMTFSPHALPQTLSAPQLPQQTKTLQSIGYQKPPNERQENLFRWEDYTQPFKTKLTGITKGNPKTVIVELPAEIAASDEVKLYVSSSVGSAWAYSSRVTLYLNGKPLPHFTIGPNYKLDLNTSLLKAGSNMLHIVFDTSDSIDVYEIRFGLPESLAQKTKSGTSLFVETIDATPPKESAAGKKTEPAEATSPPKVVAKQQPPPLTVLEKPTSAAPIASDTIGDPGQRWGTAEGRPCIYAL